MLHFTGWDEQQEISMDAYFSLWLMVDETQLSSHAPEGSGILTFLVFGDIWDPKSRKKI